MILSCLLSTSFRMQYNFVGRILGPRGMTAKQLEHETGCKIMVRGKGSMRDRKKVCLLDRWCTHARRLLRETRRGRLLSRRRFVSPLIVSCLLATPDATGGAESWETQLGAPERAAARVDHMRRHGESCGGQVDESTRGGGEAASPCRESFCLPCIPRLPDRRVSRRLTEKMT